jgi:hypothetical protein
MNNKPVLWTDGDGNYYHQNIGYYTIPLYTHPIKEFTDEEIAQIALDNYDGKSALVDKNLPWHYTIVSFARALLREAQGK